MDIIAEFNDDKGFNVKLTKDKIFITAIGNEETFALRGVNGVGLYDDIEKYNKELEDQKKINHKLNGNLMIFLGIIIGIYSIISFQDDSSTAITMIIEGIALGVGGFFIRKAKNQPPNLDSYFKLILSGGDRKFKFDKNDETSASIADFINKIEDTLTAYK